MEDDIVLKVVDDGKGEGLSFSYNGSYRQLLEIVKTVTSAMIYTRLKEKPTEASRVGKFYRDIREATMDGVHNGYARFMDEHFESKKEISND